MRKPRMFNSFFVVFLVAILCLFTSNAFAQDDFDFDDEEETSESSDTGSSSSGGGDSSMPAPKTEKEWMERIISNSGNPQSPFAPSNAGKDPFKAIVEKKVIAPPTRPQRVATTPSKPSKPAPPPVKPIKIFVSGIVGNEGQRLAIIKFENEELTVAKDQIVEGKFKVVDIQADRITVYSNKEQRRHSFKIGGDEKEKDS